MTKSDALIESKSLREFYTGRVEVLEQVKELALLPDDLHASMEMVAEYYEVGKEAINSCLKDNRDELEVDGVKVLAGDELKSLKDLGLISKHTPVFTIIPRRAILRIGMLLRDSQVAKAVRTHLLDVESNSRSNQSASKESAKRLEIMELNAKMRQAKLIFDVTHKFQDRLSDVAVESLLAAGTRTLTGQELIAAPKVEQKFHTCEEIAKKLGAMSESGLPHKKAIAALVRSIGFADSEVVTVVESTGPWQGTTDKYADSVILRLEQKLVELGYPPVLNLGKSFKVVWKSKSNLGEVRNG